MHIQVGRNNMYRRLLLAAVASGLALASGVSGAEPGYHELLLNLEDHGTVTQHISITKEKTEGGITTALGTAETEFTLTFEATDDGYKVTKSLDHFDLTGLPDGPATPGEKAVMQTALQKVSQIAWPISYTADDSLTPVRIDNFDQILTRVRKGMGELLLSSVPKDAQTDPAQLQQAQHALDSMYGNLNADNATAVFLPDDSLLGMMHNLGLTLNQPVTQDIEIPSPLGGPNITGKLVVTLTSWDEANNSARVTYDQQPDPASLKVYLDTTLPMLMEQAGTPASEVTKYRESLSDSKTAVPPLTITTHCEFEYALDTGLVRKGDCLKTAGINMEGRSQSTREHKTMSESLKATN